MTAELEGEADDVPDLGVLKAYAEYAQGNTEEAIKAIEAFVESSSDNATVQVIGATVLHSEGRSEEALSLLSKQQGSLEACVSPHWHKPRGPRPEECVKHVLRIFLPLVV